MYRSVTVLIVLLLLAPGAAGGDVDFEEGRQSAGIYLKADGLMHTVQLEFPSVSLRLASASEQSVVFRSDMDLWVEGIRVPAGRQEWTLNFTPTGWSIGDPISSGGRTEPIRFRFDLLDGAAMRSHLAAAFAPEPESSSIVLEVRLGRQTGLLRFRVTEKVAAAEDGGTGWVTGMELVREEKTVRFTLKAAVPEGAERSQAIQARLEKGALSRIFSRMRCPRAGGTQAGATMILDCESDRDVWDHVEPLPVFAASRSVHDLSQEILLLEARLDRLTRGAVADLQAFQGRLLRAKRKCGVLVSGIESGGSGEAAGGFRSFTVALGVSGSGVALVKFLRAIEDWGIPVVIHPVSLKQSRFGPEALLRLRFYDYVPLKTRAPELAESIRQAGGGPGFEEIRGTYLRELGGSKGKPWRGIEWTRDPYSPPRDDEGDGGR